MGSIQSVNEAEVGGAEAGSRNAAVVHRLEPTASVTTRTYWELRRALLCQAIKPGERLLEARLAEQLGVSRTPVREALARLVTEGLADQAPRGVVVRNIQQEIEDIYGLRQILEGYAARLAAGRIAATELNALAELSDEIGARIDGAKEDDAELQAHAELTNAFHLKIARASRSPRLIRLITTYRDYFLSSDFLRLYDHDDMQRLQRQHEAIIAALRAHDGERAERLVRQHFADAAAIIFSHGHPAHGAGTSGGFASKPAAKAQTLR
ncbi:MAG: GntR family transcriptional regulator [Acetobacteraceae bacterium]